MKKRYFWLYLIILPTIAIAGLQFIFGALLFNSVAWQSRLILALIEMIALYLMLILLWFPTWLIIAEWKNYFEIGFLHLRNVFLISLSLIVIPYDLLNHYFELNISQNTYLIFTLPLALLFFAIALAHAFKTPYRDIRELEADKPRKKTAKSRWIVFDVSALFLTFLAIISIHSWFFFSLDREKSDLMPARLLQYIENKDWTSAEAESSVKRSNTTAIKQELSPKTPQSSAGAPDDEITRMTLKKTAVITTALLPAIFFFLMSCLPIRIMQALLVVVTFHERKTAPVFYKTHRYLWHFAKAMFSKYPVLISGSLFTTFFLLIVPLILFSFGGIELYKNIHNADVIIFALIVFYAWFGQVAVAAVHPDETFGEYFDRQLSSTIMVIQNHIVYFGYGSLGNRVVQREIGEVWRTDPYGKHQKHFIETVTPDLRLEYLCTCAIIVDINSVNIIYSSQNSLLEKYGVAGPSRYKIATHETESHGTQEPRILVPTIIGDAKDPFISSRVNLERAKMLIAMIPDERGIRELFEHVCRFKQEYKDNKESLNAIICVARSDQIAYLTHRSRSRRIVLVYPKFNQGLTIGQRLWAAILKIRNVRVENGNRRWPKVLIAGNNKANHYMLETLWPQLPPSHEDPGYGSKKDYIQNNFAAIFTLQEGLAYFPVLNKKVSPDKNNNPNNFDLVWPATLQTSSRYLNREETETPAEIFIPTKEINDIDISSIEACLKEHRPDILVINHEDVEKSLLLLSRSIRALERLKSIEKESYKLPLILLSAAHGNDWELLNLGDVSRYYDALCKIHQTDIGSDLSYPGPSYYNHTERRLIGETISDLNADTEEIIVGACKSLIAKNKGDFVEINTCVQNRPGALAAYVARLGRLLFGPTQIRRFWCQFDEKNGPRLPSFQYLRDMILDPDSKRFVLTGYATLTDVGDPQHEDYTGSSTIRIFANNGENYREKKYDVDLAQDVFSNISQDINVRRKAAKWHSKRIANWHEPPKPGVPEVIDRIISRPAGIYNTVKDYIRVLYDEQDKTNNEEQGENNPCACPGMANCRIAAFQDFATASNNRRIFRAVKNGRQKPEKMLHVRNYYCSAANLDKEALQKAKPDITSYYARIFCCCEAHEDYGMIALVLNSLIFRRFTDFLVPENEHDDWTIDIQYLKDETCHNRYFSLNRLFGTLIKNPKIKNLDPKNPPLHLLRILPIGSKTSAELWYVYARSVHAFFKEIFKGYHYKFEWIGQDRISRRVDIKPNFKNKSSSDYPVVYLIKKTTTQKENPERCSLCKSQPGEYDCRNLRVWV